MTEPNRLAKWVRTPGGSNRYDRQWSAIEERLSTRSVARRTPWFAFVGVAGAITLAIVLARSSISSPDAPSSFEGATLVSAADAVALELRDGSRIDLSPESALSVRETRADVVRVALERGEARFDVAKRAGKRTFVVEAAGLEVHVLGTQFTVTRWPEDGRVRIRVAVEEGLVRIHPRGGDARELSVGESWTGFADVAPPGAPDRAPEPVRERAAEHSKKAAPSRRAAASVAPASPAELLARANDARRGGDLHEAAEAYQTLLRNHPSDARAGLAAFELGRIRMDALSDLRGATSAFERAIVLAPDAGFREDAMARLVRAHDALGQLDACRHLRDAYLSRYPRGVHRGSVAAACSTP